MSRHISLYLQKNQGSSQSPEDEPNQAKKPRSDEPEVQHEKTAIEMSTEHHGAASNLPGDYCNMRKHVLLGLRNVYVIRKEFQKLKNK